jgi:hypothetical protein
MKGLRSSRGPFVECNKSFRRNHMWKIVVGFIVFAALALWVIQKGGDTLDMGGEKHGADAVHAPEAKPAAAPAPAASGAAPAAAAPASGAAPAAPATAAAPVAAAPAAAAPASAAAKQ